MSVLSGRLRRGHILDFLGLGLLLFVAWCSWLIVRHSTSVDIEARQGWEAHRTLVEEILVSSRISCLWLRHFPRPRQRILLSCLAQVLRLRLRLNLLRGRLNRLDAVSAVIESGPLLRSHHRRSWHPPAQVSLGWWRLHALGLHLRHLALRLLALRLHGRRLLTLRLHHRRLLALRLHRRHLALRLHSWGLLSLRLLLRHLTLRLHLRHLALGKATHLLRINLRR